MRNTGDINRLLARCERTCQFCTGMIYGMTFAAGVLLAFLIT